MNTSTLIKFGPFLAGILLVGCSTAAPSVPTSPAPASITTPTRQPTTTLSTPAPTRLPTATPAASPTATVPLASAHVMSTPHGSEPGITIALAPGWNVDDHGRLWTGTEVNEVPEAMLMVWSFPHGTRFHVWGDPCRWESTQPKVPAASVDEFATALAAQKSRGLSTPINVMIDGYAGKSIVLEVPDDAVFDDCEGQGFQTYGTDADPGARSQQGPGQRDQLWLMDVDGSTVVIDAMYRGDTPTDLVAEMRTMAQSITFAPPPTAGSSDHVLADSAKGGVGITVMVPASGWTGDPGGWTMEWGTNGFDPPDGAGIIAYVVDREFYVYGDPCHWKSTRPDKPATTVDELVTALEGQASRTSGAPENFVTVDGYSGQKITMHVPSDTPLSACDEGSFATFGVPSEEPALYAQGPAEIDEIWIVDVNGKIGVLEGGYFQGTPQTAVDQLHAILSSATFD